jgi:Bacterial Ig domain
LRDTTPVDPCVALKSPEQRFTRMRARSGLVAIALSLSAVMLGGCRNDDEPFSLGPSAGRDDAPGTAAQTPVTPAPVTPVTPTPVTPTPVTSRRRPVAVDDIAQVRAGLEVTVRVLANDADDDGDVLRVAMTGQAANGRTRINSDQTITYVPRAGFVGSDSFTYTVTDGKDGSDTGSVTISVQSPVTGSSLMERIASAPAGSWIKVNINRFEDVWTPVAQRAGLNDVPMGDPRKIITAWGAMTWDDNRRQLIIWGGGHADYAGNDVYRFDAGTLRWERASLPSAVVAPFGDARFFTVDGPSSSPMSSHTYDNLEFLPLLDRLITFGGAIYNTGQYFVQDDGVTMTGPYLWDPSRASGDMVGGRSGSQVAPATFPGVTGGEMWMNRDSLVTNGVGAARPGSFVNATSAYVVEEGVESVLVSEAPNVGGDLFRYTMPAPADPSLDRWDLVGPGSRSYSDQGAGAYDPGRKLYLRTAQVLGSFGIVMWNVATPGPTNEPLRFVPADGAGRFVLSNLHGMDFDPVRSAFVLWDGGDAVWYLRPPASGPAFTASGWTVSAAPVSGPDLPAVRMTTGILGKWKYIPSHDVMMGLGGGTEGQVWVYKPVDWQPRR